MSDAQKEMKPVTGYDASGQTVDLAEFEEIFTNQVRSRKSLKLTTNHSKVSRRARLSGKICE